MNLWPQYTYLALTMVGIGVLAAKDGQPKTGNHSFLGSVLASCITWWLLYTGGFFKGLL